MTANQEKIRGNIYKLNELSVGDVFYFNLTTNKDILEVTDVVTKYNTPFEVKAIKRGNQLPNRYGSTDLFKQVVFLRSTVKTESNG